MKVRSFVEGTQRGYAYGLKDISTEKTLIERFVHDRGTPASIDEAYRTASKGASDFLTTWRHRPDIIRRSEGFRIPVK